MSDPNPPEQPSFNRPAGGDPHHAPAERPARLSGPRPRAGSPPSPAAAVPAAPTRWTRRHVEHPRPRARGAGFFTALFDFSFTNFVTPNLVRFVYLLATVALVAELAHLRHSSASPRASGPDSSRSSSGRSSSIIYLAVIRMTLEFYLSVVRMSEDIHKRLPQA